MKNIIKSVCVAALTIYSASSTANAQNAISYDQAINSLVNTGSTAKKHGVNVDAIKRIVRQNIKREGSPDPRKQSTALDDVKRLPQLIVQIQFNTDSALIRPESWTTVGRIADALHHPLLRGDRFLLVGHTDARGKRDYNLNLSDQRALSVASMLIDVYKINPRRLLALGLGEEQLRNPSKPAGQTNRRVEFFNLGPF